MPRYKLTIAYDGTDFHGWQMQHDAVKGELRTVQLVLQETARHVCRENVRVVGASRTDSGVHAEGQVAAFTIERDWELPRLAAALNSRLPDDLQVRAIELVDERFSPISDAVSKGYRYAIAHSRRDGLLPPLFDRHFSYWTPYPLDVDAMHAAAQHLVGEHDFASFTRVNHGRESTVRTVHACTVTAEHDHRCRIEISGSGFLYNMVRIVAGTLVDVGRGRHAPDHVRTILDARSRAAAGSTLPPEGLCLMWIEYPGSTP
ncbi:MAG: tRNA pseudouridine(38-40) synthase TruA [Phycisphaerales bacterium]|nr:tRNA pseudouridine(38-40) synthase TruA [Phycisphaerales bacterium]